MKVKRRKASPFLRGKAPTPTGPNQQWSMDVVHVQSGWPQAITVDNGTEFTSKPLDEWAPTDAASSWTAHGLASLPTTG
ncbi:MAG: hypothetical protein ABIN08_09960 [Caldimonas sp.]